MFGILWQNLFIFQYLASLSDLYFTVGVVKIGKFRQKNLEWNTSNIVRLLFKFISYIFPLVQYKAKVRIL